MSDPLTSLPTELLHNIFSLLIPSHDVRLSCPSSLPRQYYTSHASAPHQVQQRFAPLAPGLPLLNLTLTSRALQSAINAFSHLLLLKWSHIKNYRPLKTASLEAKRNSFATLLKLIRTHCVFCGKKSSRRATLMNGLGCCAACDKKEWPDKITRSDAKKKFGLGDKHLFTLGGNRPENWPVVRFGTYSVMGGECMLLEKNEVERLAKVVKDEGRGKKRNAVQTEEEKEVKRVKAEKAKVQRVEKKAKEEAEERRKMVVGLCLRRMKAGDAGSKEDLKKIFHLRPDMEAYASGQMPSMMAELDEIADEAAKEGRMALQGWPFLRTFTSDGLVSM
ncbi:Hypothetical protein D9617_23g005530 [Elsinoe fawcettii]|nr:Hypothetical protein D9617_23g005530 [Elsinoe fawcettii]